MKKTLLSLLLIVFITSIAYAGTLVKVWEAKAINTTTNTTYTSGVFSVGDYEDISYMINTVGTDSCKITVVVEAEVGGSWQTRKTDILKYGDATSGLKWLSVRLRNTDLDSLSGVDRIRFKATVVPFAAADSTSATSYSLNLLAR